MDRAISKDKVRKRSTKRVVNIAAAIALILVMLYGFNYLIQPRIDLNNYFTDQAIVGDIEGTLNGSGVVMPEYEQVITSPIFSRVDSVFCRAGDRVSIDSRVVALDMVDIHSELVRKRDQLKLKQNRKNQLELQLERDLINLETEKGIKDLRLQYLKSKLEQERKLYNLGGGTKQDLEQAELNIKIGRLEEKQLKKQIVNRKRSLLNDLEEIELEIKILLNSIGDIERNIEGAKTYPSYSGVVTWVNDNIGGVVNRGDVVAKVANLNSYKVDGKISEIHLDKLHLGGEVKVMINGSELKGKISNINPEIRNGVLDFSVTLNEKNSPLLRSNMKVEIYVITSSKRGVTLLKNGGFINGSGYNKIFVVKGDKAIRREINVGITNFESIEVLSGVEQGERVIISNMDDYLGMSEIDINR